MAPRIPAGLAARFEVLGLAGSGTTGHVFRARDRSGGGVVALKIAHPDPEDPGRPARIFRQEFETLSIVHHRGIVAIHEAGESDGTPFLVMEFVEGETLRQRVDRGPLPEREALVIVYRIAEAIAHYDAMGLTHGDLKPQNVLIGARGVVKLCDLGVAERAYLHQRVAGDARHAGTPLYTSPEIIRRSAEIDVRSDLYSLGITLFHLLTGGPPFTGATVEEIYRAHLTEPVPALPGVSPGARAILARLLVKDPAGRYRFPFQLVEDVRGVIEGRPPLHALRPPEEEAVATSRRSAVRKRGGIPLAAGLVLGVAALWFAFGRGDEPEPVSPGAESEIELAGAGSDGAAGAVAEPAAAAGGSGEHEGSAEGRALPASAAEITTPDGVKESVARAPTDPAVTPLAATGATSAPGPAQEADAAAAAAVAAGDSPRELSPEMRELRVTRRAPLAEIVPLVRARAAEVPGDLLAVSLENDLGAGAPSDWVIGPGWQRSSAGIARDPAGRPEQVLAFAVELEPDDWVIECVVRLAVEAPAFEIAAGDAVARILPAARSAELLRRDGTGNASTLARPSRGARLDLPAEVPLRLRFARTGERIVLSGGVEGTPIAEWVSASSPVSSSSLSPEIRADRAGLEIAGSRITGGVTRTWCAREIARRAWSDRILAAFDRGDWAEALFPGAARSRGKDDALELFYDFARAEDASDWRPSFAGGAHGESTDGRLALAAVAATGNPAEPWDFPFAAVELAAEIREVASLEYEVAPVAESGYALGHFVRAEAVPGSFSWDRALFAWLGGGLTGLSTCLARGPGGELASSDFAMRPRERAYTVEHREKWQGGEFRVSVAVDGKSILEGVAKDEAAPVASGARGAAPVPTPRGRSGPLGLCSAGAAAAFDDVKIVATVDPAWRDAEMERRADRLRRARAVERSEGYLPGIGPEMVGWERRGGWSAEPKAAGIAYAPPEPDVADAIDPRDRREEIAVAAIAYLAWPEVRRQWPARAIEADFRFGKGKERAGFAVGWRGSGEPWLFVGYLGGEGYGAALIPGPADAVEGAEPFADGIARAPSGTPPPGARPARWRLEERGHSLRLAIDGKPVLECELPEALRAPHGAVGFAAAAETGSFTIREIRILPAE